MSKAEKIYKEYEDKFYNYARKNYAIKAEIFKKGFNKLEQELLEEQLILLKEISNLGKYETADTFIMKVVILTREKIQELKDKINEQS